MAALHEMFDESALNPAALSVDEPRYLITMTGGEDGNVPTDADYRGESDEVNGSTGLAALEDIEEIAIVMTPAAAAHPGSHQAVVTAMLAHCRKMRYRIGIVDAEEGMSLSEVRDFRSNFDDSRLALYYPWVVIGDPRGITDRITCPPAGFVAGVYANTDVQRGVHKPPANETLPNVLGFAQQINRFQQELLNPNGINCLRSFENRGHRVWGGRTLSSDPEWKYVNVRRYFLYLERSIEKSTQWVVFEPNGERLWSNVRSTVDSFLYNEWVNGRLLGSAKTAYFVRCDRSTMTQNDLDNGRLVCEIGVAALKPAEFVVFRIGQKTADA
jgi:phage tail sheath protein FI